MTPQEGLSVAFVVSLFMLSMKRVHGRMKRGVRALRSDLTPLAATSKLFVPIWLDMALTVLILMLGGVLVNAFISRGKETVDASVYGLLGGSLLGVDALYAMNLALSSAGVLAFWYTLWLRIKNAHDAEYRTMLDVVYGFNGVILPVLYVLHPLIVGG